MSEQKIKPTIKNNEIPEFLEYLGIEYKFTSNKGNILCYSHHPGYISDSNGDTIIVEYRQDKRPADQFYVLFHISAYSLSDFNATTTVSNLKNLTRQAKIVNKK